MIEKEKPKGWSVWGTINIRNPEFIEYNKSLLLQNKRKFWFSIPDTQHKILLICYLKSFKKITEIVETFNYTYSYVCSSVNFLSTIGLLKKIKNGRLYKIEMTDSGRALINYVLNDILNVTERYTY